MLHRPKFIVGDEVIVGVRGKIIDVGVQLASVSLFELMDQYRVGATPIVFVPLDAIEERCPPERVGPEVRE